MTLNLLHNSSDTLFEVAVPTPLRKTFYYLPPVGSSELELGAGSRVLVPFSGRKVVAVVISSVALSEAESQVDFNKLKAVESVIDTHPILSPMLLKLGLWASQYYLHPIGEVLIHMLPALLRKGEAAKASLEAVWMLTDKGRKVAWQQFEKKSPRQAELIKIFQSHGHQHSGLLPRDVSALGFSSAQTKALKDKSLIEKVDRRAKASWPDSCHSGPILNNEQQAAVDQLQIKMKSFGCFLLEGVTGSGKTEVYLRAVQQCLEAKKQVLILVPEIGLTPQTLNRFRKRFDHSIAVLHSGLSDKERLNQWLAAKNGDTAIVIGTRSSVFTPLKKPGLIVVDEEHDLSFKQQDGFRYHARDLAIKRASIENIPVILGSATPSLETINNADAGRYGHLLLKERAGNAKAPKIEILDLKDANLSAGVSEALTAEIKTQLGQGNQVLLFLNRRGYAPTLMCEHCGWVSDCDQCDARMTLHKNPAKLMCHHCGNQQPIPHQCPQCHSPKLQALGMGTARTEEQLQLMFPDYPVIRIDRDSTQKQDAFEKLLEPVRLAKPCILVGTQMLAKGHHFPHVTLAAILDADAGLFASDFRSVERMTQLLTQVAGRSGRAEKPGKVVIQTWHPTHPVFNALQLEGYGTFSRQQLIPQRQMANLPPFQSMALIRCDAKRESDAESFLNKLLPLLSGYLQTTGPLPAPLSRRAGMFRKWIIVQSHERKHLLATLNHVAKQVEQSRINKGLSWGIDIDPQDFS